MVKQSFIGLPGQHGRRVTKANIVLPLANCVRFVLSLSKREGTFTFTKHALHITRYNTPKAESLKKSLVYKNLTWRSIDDFSRGVSKLKIKLEMSGRGANFQFFFDDVYKFPLS